MKRALALYVFLSLSVLGGFNKAQGSSHKSSSSPWQILPSNPGPHPLVYASSVEDRRPT